MSTETQTERTKDPAVGGDPTRTWYARLLLVAAAIAIVTVSLVWIFMLATDSETAPGLDRSDEVVEELPGTAGLESPQAEAAGESVIPYDLPCVPNCGGFAPVAPHLAEAASEAVIPYDLPCVPNCGGFVPVAPHPAQAVGEAVIPYDLPCVPNCGAFARD